MDFEMRLDYQDSNLDKQNQNLLCYHYTIVQFTHLTLPTNLYSPTRPDFTA